jgi:hypothetical protein
LIDGDASERTFLQERRAWSETFRPMGLQEYAIKDKCGSSALSQASYTQDIITCSGDITTLVGGVQ